MRIFSLCCLIVVLLTGCKTDTKTIAKDAQKNQNKASVKASPFQVNGNIEGLKTGYVLLKNKLESKFITIDSTELSNGSFTLHGNIKVPEVYALIVADENRVYGTKSFFVEPGEMMINANVKNIRNASITGSESEEKMMAFKDRLKDWNNEINEFYEHYKSAGGKGDKGKQAHINNKIDEIYERKLSFIKSHVLGNLDDPISPYITINYLVSSGISIQELEQIAKGLAPELDASKYTRQVKSYYNVLVNTGVGNPAIDFTLHDAEDNPIALSSTRGKYVLLDFWASWCDPCREENPNIVNAYKKYKKDGFTVYAVSLDVDKNEWMKAIQDDNLSYINVSDRKGWDSEAARLYGVRGIPHSLLIGKDGKIIAKNLRGNDLQNKLEELFQ